MIFPLYEVMDDVFKVSTWHFNVWTTLDIVCQSLKRPHAMKREHTGDSDVAYEHALPIFGLTIITANADQFVTIILSLLLTRH